MSKENVEIVMAAYRAAQTQDASGFSLCDEQVVWDMTGLGMPDLARVYNGLEGLRDFWSRWLTAWETIEFDTVAVEEHGDHVIVEVRQRNRGRTSGVLVDFHYFQSFTVRDGKITASHAAEKRGAVVEAVGLAE